VGGRVPDNIALKTGTCMNVSLSSFQFDTTTIPIEARFQSWAAMIPYFHVEQPAGADDFVLRAKVWLLEGMVLSVNTMPPVTLERTAASIAADARTDYVVVLSRNGSWRASGAGSRLVAPGAVCVLDNCCPYRVESSGGEFIILNVSRPLLDDPRLPFDLHAQLFGNTLALVFADFLFALCQRLPMVAQDEAPALTRALRDLLVACLAAGHEALWHSRDDISVLHRAKRYIDRNLASALTVADVARAMGVSRTHLYRIFAGIGGVERFVMRQRLTRAHALLSNHAERRRGVAEVAYATGFSGLPHFSRLFKAHFGITPTQARANIRVGAAPPAREFVTADSRRLQTWVSAPLERHAKAT
jgi:AraC-like DNA-binding protein